MEKTVLSETTETITIKQTMFSDNSFSMQVALLDTSLPAEGDPISLAYAMASVVVDLFDVGVIEQVCREKFNIPMTRTE